MQREHGGQFDFQLGEASKEPAGGRVKKGGKEEGVPEKEKKKKKKEKEKEKDKKGKAEGREERGGVRLQEIPNEVRERERERERERGREREGAEGGKVSCHILFHQ